MSAAIPIDAPGAPPSAPEELLRRTVALAPRLAARAAACEALRRCPDETIAEMHDAGLMRMMQPRRFGGAELGPEAMLEVVLEMSAWCPSSSWVYLNLATHAWNIAQFGLRAQADVWEADPDAVAATGLAFPCGKAVPADGGYVVSGRWPFASGIDAASWMLVGAFVDRGAAPPERRLFLVPKPDFRSLGNWHAYGLAGSGSHDVEISGAFVPEHRTLAGEVIADGASVPGGRVHDAPMYRLPTFSTFGFFLAMVPVGAARGAVAQFVSATRERAGTYTGARLAELTPLQIRVAEAAACVDFAERMLRHGLRELLACAEAGENPAIDLKLRWKRDLAFAVGLCTRAVDALMGASGAGGLYTDRPLQRLFRDVHAASAHIALTWDVQAAAYGRHALGLPLDPGLLL
jgi:3-hydroxy-9,10-secoandrosta-1,3,5(10)-triene-9,17-dione monooxygenase